MRTMIVSFPFEIIEKVNVYFTQEERYNLVLVNKAYHAVFTRLLYRTVTIESKRQWKRLLNNFETTKSSQSPLGNYVLGLSVLLEQVTEVELQRLQYLCPFVQSIHIDWRIWDYLSNVNNQPHKLTTFAHQFITHYGPCKLTSLVLDLSHMANINPASILSCTPHLRSLTLMNEQTFDYSFINQIHALCPHLESLNLDGYIAEADSHLDDTEPMHRMKSFQLKAQYGADHCQDWLPFIALKYPQLRSLVFHHSGEGKDMIELGPRELYRHFLQQCPHLTHLSWYETAPDFQFLHDIDRPLHTLRILDSLPLNSLVTSALFENQYMQSMHRLEIGPLPRDITPNALIDSIGRACPCLQYLTLCETECNLSQPFKIDVILEKCRALVSLLLKHIAIRVSFPAHANRVHPLKVLEMQHCSSFDGMFEHVSACCPRLRELRLFALTQRDRRYKVQIRLPNQQLKKVKIQGLRTETFDVNRRIRFFCIRESEKTTWYYMNGYRVDANIEESEEMKTLDESDVCLLDALMHCKTNNEKSYRIEQYLKLHPESIAQNWESNHIHDAGYVDVQCDSIQHLYLNKHLIN